jgi:hypothetical protein
MRDEIVTQLETYLKNIATKNSYHTNFDKVTYWQTTPTEEEKNHLDFRDTTEEYQRENARHKSKLHFEIVATVFGGNKPAAVLGNLALEDLIGAVKSFSYRGAIVELLRSHKFVETKNRTACQIELEIAICYKF